jgi:hypothetical protein
MALMTEGSEGRGRNGWIKLREIQGVYIDVSKTFIVSFYSRTHGQAAPICLELNEEGRTQLVDLLTSLGERQSA